ncbi:unnamed protein product [Strongylus vulgaris]|uniref:Uncharacterized protein n=1 Tax=Strongylus vulgaris TaxID=40348 RepID=A0A3P7J4L5_STRVU|nr:unnamed protein product [Strongylus vulgaris]
MADAGDAEELEEEIVEDRFDDESFDDAPLSDPDSDFDEQELLSVDDCDGFVGTVDRLREPKSFTVVIILEKASEIMQREQESFFRGHGRFIQDDPRFERSHFEKENSWEPSIHNLSSFDRTDSPVSIENPTPLPQDPGAQEQSQQIQQGSTSDEKAIENIPLSCCSDAKSAKDTVLPTDSLELLKHKADPRGQNLPRLQNLSVKEPVSTPQKRLERRSLVGNDGSPVIANESSIIGAQTSTPVSTVAKLPTRQRLRDFDKMVQEISIIKAEGTPSNKTNEISHMAGNHSLAESTDTTMLSVGQIQSMLKGIKSGSPATLMRELEAQRRSRVKLRKPRDLPPLPPKSRRESTDNANLSGALSLLRAEKSVVRNDTNANSRLDATRQREETVCFILVVMAYWIELIFQSHKATVKNNEEMTAHEEVQNRRPQSARSSSSLSTVTNVRSSSQMSSDSSQSQIILLDPHRTTSLRVEFCASQNARFCTSLSINASGGGGPALTYRMPVRGVGGTAVLTVKDREDLRLSRNGSYVLQSSYESTFSFTLVNSGKRHAFARTVVLYYGESGNPEKIPVDIRPAPGVVIGRDESTVCSPRIRPRPSLASNTSLERSLQPEDTFRERTAYNTLMIPDQTIRANTKLLD